MTPQQCVRAAKLLEQWATVLMRSNATDGCFATAEQEKEHREHRKLAGALRAMVARHYAKPAK